MNDEQKKLIESYNRMKSSSLYTLAQVTKEQCIQNGKTPEDIEKLFLGSFV